MLKKLSASGGFAPEPPHQGSAPEPCWAPPPDPHSPFPQIDIIGAMVIVWRVRGKIIRSVMCNIVRNNCAQCNAHTYEQT